MESGLVGRSHVQHSCFRIGGRAAPVRSTQLARHRNLLLREAHRRVDAFVARRLHDVEQSLALVRLEIRVDLVRRKFQPRIGRRLGGKRLRERCPFTRHITRRHRPLFDGPQRLAGDAVEDEDHPDLADLRDDVHRLAVVLHREQLGAGGRIVIPQIVMHELKMPEAFAGVKVEREQAVAEQIVAEAIAAVEIEGWRAEREIADAALLVDRELSPRIGAAGGLPRVGRPGVVAEFSRPRDRVKDPQQLAAPHGRDRLRPGLDRVQHQPVRPVVRREIRLHALR